MKIGDKLKEKLWVIELTANGVTGFFFYVPGGWYVTANEETSTAFLEKKRAEAVIDFLKKVKGTTPRDLAVLKTAVFRQIDLVNHNYVIDDIQF